MNKPLYWSNQQDKYTNLALSMLSITGYAQNLISSARFNRDFINWTNASRLDTDFDPITMMIVMYTMLRENREYAHFRVQDGSFYLLSNFGFYSPATQLDVETQDVCESSIHYQFSPLYHDIPSDIPTILFQLEPDIINTQKFTLILEQALMSDEWKKYIPRLMEVMDVDQEERESMYDMLNRIIAKTKLQHILDIIMDAFPCIIVPPLPPPV